MPYEKCPSDYDLVYDLHEKFLKAFVAYGHIPRFYNKNYDKKTMLALESLAVLHPELIDIQDLAFYTGTLVQHPSIECIKCNFKICPLCWWSDKALGCQGVADDYKKIRPCL